MIVVVSGSREFKGHTVWPLAALNWLQIWSEQAGEPLKMIHGFARGFDKYVYRWVQFQRKAGKDVSEQGYPADWGRYGKGAGVLRNDEMLRLHGHELDLGLCLPHPEGSGTQDMMRKLREAGIPIWELGWDAKRLSAPPQARLIPANHGLGAP
jgi:hypothetical protein